MTWHIDGDAIYEPGSEPGDIVCVRPGSEWEGSDAKWRERAPLIAAAPELYEALADLKHAAVYLSASMASKSRALHERADTMFYDALEKANAALSRATAQNVGEG